MLIVIIRTLILLVLIIIALRLMGARQIGQLQPYELVIIILLADLAVIPMADTGIPLVAGALPILILLLTQVTLSYTGLKSEWARGVICGTPTVLVENGKILEGELRRARYNINELLEEMRAKNMPNIADVEFAILETGGMLTVIPKSQKRPLNPADMNIPTKYEGLPITLIIDGKVMHQNLNKNDIDEQWLQTELNKFGIKNFKDVLFASVDTEGKLFYQAKST